MEETAGSSGVRGVGFEGEGRGRAISVADRTLTIEWLGRIDYREAWALQKRLAGERADGLIGDRLLLLEHPPVLTLGRGADDSHILASPAQLARRGIEVVRVERGGEVTYHGPGQLVAYPIVALSRLGLLIRPLVRALEGAMADTCRAYGVEADRREGHPGCWVDPEGARPLKIGALGLRVERGVSYHGIALNVTTDLADFELIDPCGMPGVESTSIAREAGNPAAPPTTDSVATVAGVFAPALGARLGVSLDGDVPRGHWTPVLDADGRAAARGHVRADGRPIAPSDAPAPLRA
jgi:lipoyl(octanoyl) transferase